MAASEAAFASRSNSASKEAKGMKRFGSATWSGSLGNGAVSTESQAMTNCPYTFFSRYGERCYG
jgi:hypothetical protein